jgi:RND family efflux transporter MFP subunit
MTRAAFAALPVLALVLAATATACSPSAASPAVADPPPTAVRVAPIERVHRARPVHATGVLASKAELRASFKVGGLIAQLTVDEGDPVRKGQVLGRLTTTEIDAGVEQARQGLTKAERDLGRAEKLFAGQAATREQLDDATTAAAVSRAQVRAAEFNRQHAVIRAPGDGRVLRRLAETGEMVAPGQPIFFLSGDRAGWIVRVGLADRDVVRIAPGDQATLEFAAYPDQPFAATVDEIASAATPPLGTYEVELRLVLPADGPQPLSGLIASVAIAPTGGQHGAPEVALIPASALRDGDGKQAAVWVPDGKGGVARRTVTLAFFAGEQVAIATGLDGADTVVTDGAAYLGVTSKIAIAAEPK